MKTKHFLLAALLGLAGSVGAEGVRSTTSVPTRVVQFRMTNLSHPVAYDAGNKLFDCEMLNEDDTDALLFESQEATGFSTSASGLTTASYEAPTKSTVVRVAPLSSAPVRMSFSAWIYGVIVQPEGNALTAATLTCSE